jgi:hypothetical protein
MIRRILRTYLSLTRGERNGFFILAILILILLTGRIMRYRIMNLPERSGAMYLHHPCPPFNISISTPISLLTRIF